MTKKIKVFSLIIALIVNLCVVPTHISYADTISNPIRKIAIQTTAMAVAVGSALGLTVGEAGYNAYETYVLNPIKSYLRRYEEKDGVIGAYYKDGKTYVSKEMIQGTATYLNDNQKFTNISNEIDGIYLDTFLDVDGVMDVRSFFMSCPYFAEFANKYPDNAERLCNTKGLPYYYTHTNYNGTKYTYGIFKFDDKVKYFKLTLNPGSRIIQISRFNGNRESVSISDINNGRVCIDLPNGSFRYETGIANKLYYTPSSEETDFGFRIGLTKQIISEPQYTVASDAIKGNTIDNWDSAWAQQVIDVLKDMEINTSISADAIADATADKIIDALPLSLPQYGIDGTTADVAIENTASIPMSQAKSGEVVLSPSAIDELSEDIAKAISESGVNTGEQTIVGEITIPQPVYSGLSSYELDLTDVFPFCIPFDLVDLIKVFSASPEAPKFSIPIKYPTGFNSWESYDLEVDLSSFDSVALVVRTLETVLFILGLLKITRSAMIRG